ncbi:hypothetical protein KAR91_45925, partial [Candidatus Pacearchaeota archaeon]|nr:hypothetical protein [Candidatus Pacearchaeota archaeon]
MANDGCLLDKEECFQIYFSMGSSRSFERLIKQLEESHPGFVPSMVTIKTWSSKGEWKNRVKSQDEDIRQGVLEKLLPDWIDIKKELLDTLLDQVRQGREQGVTPENTRDLVAAVREIRSIMGEGDDLKEITTKVQFEFVEPDSEK